jgi:Fe2+ transport system protein FeoA
VGWKKRKKAQSSLDKNLRPTDTEIKMQLSVNCDLPEPLAASLSNPLVASLSNPLAASLMDLRQGDVAILDGIDLPTDDARRLMELGFLPGMQITAGRSAPGGDPQVFQVDGSEIALRRETARHLSIRRKLATLNTEKLDTTPRA